MSSVMARGGSVVGCDALSCASSSVGRRLHPGVIANDASIGQAHKSHGVFVYKPKFFNYPGFWANQKRKWYWQSFRISCGEEAKSSDCKVEGPIRTFTLR